MPTLELNDRHAELGTTKIVLNKSAYQLADWLAKGISFSERVRLPGTNQLNETYLRPLSPNISGSKFSKYVDFKYKDAGAIIFSGTSILLSVSENNQFELQLLDSSKQLFDNMQNNINAIDFESSDFVFNSTEYSNKKTLNSSIWLWCAASMHEKKVLGKNVLSGELAYSRPFFSVKRLIESIFDANNWSYELSSDASEFDKRIISSNADSFVFTSYEKEFDDDEIVVSGTHILDLSSPIFLKTDTVTALTTLNLNFDSKIRLRGVITSTADVVLQIAGTSSAPDSQTENFIINEGTFFYDITSNIFATSGTTYDIQISLIGTATVTFTQFTYLYTIIDENAFGAMSAKGFIGFKVKTYDNLPDISQIDIFKHALISVAGFFNTDNLRKKISINSILEVTQASAIDFSDKLIENTMKAYQISRYGKKNYYQYDNDSVKPSNLGRGSFDIDNPTFKDTESVYNSIFAASTEVTITDKQIDLEVYDDTERTQNLNDIIGYYETIGAYTVARFADMNGRAILTTYFQNFINALKKGEVFQASFDLNKTDYFSFDFTKQIYLKQKRSNFYVMNIESFGEGVNAKLTLLKS